jgi:AAA lid domain
MTAFNRAPEPEQDLGELVTLSGLEEVAGQIAPLIAVLRAEQARRRAGIEIRRPAWKNLVFYWRSRDRQVPRRPGRRLPVPAARPADLRQADRDRSRGSGRRHPPRHRGPGSRCGQADGDLLMITGVHAWSALRGRGQHVLRCLYQAMTHEHRHSQGGELVIILAGQAGPLSEVLAATPALAARLPAVIDFPGYSPAQLAAVFTALACEAGFTLTSDAMCKAAAVLARAETGRASGNARLAVQLLNYAATAQAGRITTSPQPPDIAALATICAADIPGRLDPAAAPALDQRPGQYL